MKKKIYLSYGILVIILLTFVLVAVKINATTFSDINALADNALEKCVNGTRGQCVVALDDFRKKVKDDCQNYNESACEYGITKFWRTTRDIGNKDGYFTLSLLEATGLTSRAYNYDEVTKEYTRYAFKEAVHEIAKVNVTKCTDTCTSKLWNFVNMSITYHLNGTDITNLTMIINLEDDEGQTLGILALEGNGGGGSGPGVWATITETDGTTIQERYSNLDTNLESSSDNWVKLE